MKLRNKGQGAKADVEEKKETASPKNVSHEEIEIDDQLQAKIDFVGDHFGFIRQWPGQDGGDYATISPKVAKALPDDYVDVAEVAEEVIKELKEYGEDLGRATFATYDIRYGKTKGIGRLIKVNEERKLTFALEVEHQVTSAKGKAKAFNPSKERTEKEEKVEKTSSFGFGKG